MSVISEPLPALTRQAQKERTREAILDAALALTGDQGLAQVSLRQVAREAGIVPTGFYRHFESMEELGLALVARSFATLRIMIREAQRDSRAFANVIDSSAGILVSVVKDNRPQFRFIARERFSGQTAIREAINRELDRFVSEQAILLARMPELRSWTSEDIHMLAKLFVRNMVSIAEDVIDMPEGRPDLEGQILAGASRQMRLIVIGVRSWKSSWVDE